LINKVEEAGFNIYYLGSFISLLFPFMVASRFLNKDGNDELNISSTINRIFYLITLFELKLIKIVVRVPFGGSLLIVAKK